MRQYMQKQYYTLILIQPAIIAFAAIKPPHWQAPKIVVCYIVCCIL